MSGKLDLIFNAIEAEDDDALIALVDQSLARARSRVAQDFLLDRRNAFSRRAEAARASREG